MQPPSPSLNWDLIQMAFLYNPVCQTESVILLRWQEAHDAPRGMGASVERSALPADAPIASGTVATIVPSPQQLRCASQSYESGAHELRAKNYPAAAVDFKK